jgi:hypothetical protein
VDVPFELAKREENLVELVFARSLGGRCCGRWLSRIGLAGEQRAAQRIAQVNEEVVVLDHGIHVSQERALPLLLLGEPALDQRRFIGRFIFSHAVSGLSATAPCVALPRASCPRRASKKTERFPSLGMVLKNSSQAGKSAATAMGG